VSCTHATIDTLPRTLHWIIRPGASTFDFTFRILEGGVAVDITTYDFELIIRRPNGIQVLSLGMGDGISLVSSTQGRATVDSTDSAALPQDMDLQWEFNTTFPTAEEYDLLAGIVMVTARTSVCEHVPADTDFTFTATPLTFDFEVVRTTEGPYTETIHVEDGDTFQMPAGRMLMAIAVAPDDDDRILSAGYTAGGTDLLDHVEIPGGTGEDFTETRMISYHTAKTFHFSGDAATIKLFIF
jgi:hypothetical protein